MSQNFNLWKMLVIMARRKKFIVGFILICTVTAVVVALVLPKWYQAKTSILPSQYDQLLGITGNFTQFTMTSAGFELPLMATPSDVYATMLKSETVVRAVIDELDLQRYYDMKSLQECSFYLRDKMNIKVTGEGVVELFYEDKDPEMAARVANSFIANLDKLNRQVKVSKAKSDREFIELRLHTTEALLDSARAQLLAFQTEHKAVDLKSQQQLAIASATELKAQLAVTQVSLDVKKKSYSADHPEVQRLENHVAELKRQLSAIETGDGSTSYLDLPLAEIPELSVTYARLEADVSLQEKVHSMLTELLEEARIKEQKDTPTISILETAFPPEIKYKPKRTIIVASTFVCSLILAIFIVLFADYIENLRRSSPSDFELLNQARREITGKTNYPDS